MTWPTTLILNSQQSKRKRVTVMSTFMCLYRLREQQTQRQLRMYWCHWAGQEVFPFWLTRAPGVSQRHGTVKFPHLGQDCVQPWHLFSVEAERAVEQGCWAIPWTVVFLSAGWSGSLPAAPRSHGQLTREKDETGCLHATVLAPRQVLGADSHAACKRSTKTGIGPLFDRLGDPSTYLLRLHPIHS